MDPTAQLESELQEDIVQALCDSRRPILTHVNADTTWLIQIPCPLSQASPTGRLFVNLLIDPWLSGPQSDVASWFSTQWHVVPSSIGSISEMERYLADVEELAWERLAFSGSRKSSRPAGSSHIDAVLICHEFTDHCHKATLLELNPDVPILANDKAVDLIKSWNYFDNVSLLPSFERDETDWRKTRVPSLPEWVGISRIISPGNNLYYHSALLVVADLNADMPGTDAACSDAIIYSPHGIVADDLEPVAQAKPPLRILALLHGLHDVSLTSYFQLNLGAHNGLKAARITRPKYWIASHDEPKKGGGIVGRFLQRKVISLEDALEKERLEAGDNADILRDVNFSELGSGESLLLS